MNKVLISQKYAIIRLFHTLRYLKLRQIINRFQRRVYHPVISTPLQINRRKIESQWIFPIPKSSHIISPSRFTFLGEDHDCTFPKDWNNNKLKKLWLYNLHYFDDLERKNARSQAQMHTALLRQWMNDNPPGHGNGWEPYPISLRIVNIIKWLLADNFAPDELLHNLAVQAAYLQKNLEYHLLGNHLFANAKALVFAGLFFEGKEAEGLLKKGMDILAQEVPEQILDDGGHFEQSPMYHAIILEDMLDMMNICRAYGYSYPKFWEEKTGHMLFWLKNMCHPDGQISLFNDAAFTIAAKPVQLYDYAQRLNIEKKNSPDNKKDVLYLEKSGYICWNNDNAALIMDVGNIGPDYIPGHAHADTLSFELSLFAHRFIVNSGTSLYEVNSERLRQRGTAAHNTVIVDNENSSEVWSGFRVARRARPSRVQTENLPLGAQITCSHDGYKRLPGKVTHQRTWKIKPHELRLEDTLFGRYNRAEARFHFHPDITIEHNGKKSFTAKTPNTGRVTIEIIKGIPELQPSTYHPEFGLTVENLCLSVALEGGYSVVHFHW